MFVLYLFTVSKNVFALRAIRSFNLVKSTIELNKVLVLNFEKVRHIVLFEQLESILGTVDWFAYKIFDLISIRHEYI